MAACWAAHLAAQKASRWADSRVATKVVQSAALKASSRAEMTAALWERYLVA